MNYLRFTQYAYLLAAVFFAIDAFISWRDGENFIISALFAAVCVFTFFFRRRFAQKFAERNKKP
jgi:positive regulator of sigma E activity